MAFADLTAEQQSILAEHTRLLRAWAGEQARVMNHGEAIDTNYWAQVSAILAELQSSDEITDGSGLAGAATLTANKTTNAGDTFTLSIGDIDASLS